MATLFGTTLDDQIACALREVEMRRRVYPRLVASGKMTRTKADDETHLMEEIAATLRRLKEQGASQ